MFYIIVGGITGIAFILLIFAIYYNKFQFVIVKIEEAENNIDIYLKKKLDLIKRISPVIRKKLKDKKLLEEVDNNYDSLNSFELNDKLSSLNEKVFNILDDNEKLLKSEKIVNLINDLNNNDENLTASIKFYNNTIVDFNRLILSFPSNFIRLFFGYKKKEFYSNEKREVYEILKEEKKEK